MNTTPKKSKPSKKSDDSTLFTKQDFERLVDKAIRTPASPPKDKHGKE